MSTRSVLDEQGVRVCESVPIGRDSEAKSLVELRNVKKHFPIHKGVLGRAVGQVRAVDGVSLQIFPGETLGLVGESGCGKSTVGRVVMQLLPETSGEVRLLGRLAGEYRGRERLNLRQQIQIIFQDPYSSLNPRMRVFDIVAEALAVHGLARGAELKARVERLLSKVGVAPAWMNRFPHEFSGGQRQRIGIARALAMNPKLIVCDEAVSALDVSIQAQILNLLMDLREELNLAYLFISHDLSVVRHISHRIAVMYLGEIVEVAETDRLFKAPLHPYTQALLAAVPNADPENASLPRSLSGDVPSPSDPPPGCRFHTRCPIAMDRCRREPPKVVVLRQRWVRCHRIEEELKGAAETVRPDNDGGVALEELLSGGVRELYAAKLEEDAGASRAVLSELWRETGPSVRKQSEKAGGDVLPPIAMLLNGTGAVLALLSHWFWAAIVLLAGAGLLALKPHFGWTPRRTLWLAAACVLLSIPIGRFLDQRVARSRLAAMAAEVDAYRANVGELPARLGELGYRLHASNVESRDPWEHAFYYERVELPEPAYRLRSLGPDGVPSEDDISWTEGE